MSEKDNIEIENIIIDMLAGEKLSPKEEYLLTEWLKDQKHKQRLYELQCIQNAFYAHKVSEKIDEKQAWKTFTQHHSTKLNLRLLITCISAAIVTILIGFGLLLTLQQEKTRKFNPPITTQISSHSANIVLTLSDGEQIILSDSVNDLQERNGTTIRNKAQQLIYHPTASNEQVVYNTIKIPRGSEYQLILADGTTIWLNSESEITFPVNFTGEKREVELKGEAFFNVAKDEAHPFIVQTEQFDIRVTGTQFNVRVYRNESASATLAEGSIQLIHQKQITPLTPGQQAFLKKGTVEVKNVNLKEAIAWRYNTFHFKQQPLENLLNEIARWYDVEIIYQNPTLKGLHFTAGFQRSCSITEVINTLEMTEKIRLEIKGKTLIVKEYK